MLSSIKSVGALALLLCAAALPGGNHAHAQSLDIGVDSVGISFGNSPRWTGLRVNLRDAHVRRVDGVNITLWRPHENTNEDFAMNGIALGVVAPNAGTFSGAAIGLGGVLAERAVNGVAIGLRKPRRRNVRQSFPVRA